MIFLGCLLLSWIQCIHSLLVPLPSPQLQLPPFQNTYLSQIFLSNCKLMYMLASFMNISNSALVYLPLASVFTGNWLFFLHLRLVVATSTWLSIPLPMSRQSLFPLFLNISRFSLVLPVFIVSRLWSPISHLSNTVYMAGIWKLYSS